MATPPTFVASYGNIAWSTATQTASVTVTAGDLLVVAAGTLESNLTVATPSGGGLTFTLQQVVASQTQQSNTYVWTATAPSSATFTLAMSATGYYVWFAEVWRTHNGVGASAKKTATATTSLSLTTQGANSALIVVNNDWNGVNGTTRTWLTSVGALTEVAYQRISSGGNTGGFYGGHHADSGVVGAKTVGMSAPTGQRPSLIALEVLAAPPAATGSLSITATALSANVPPAVRIDVTDTRSPGQASQLTIVRNNPDGTQSPVRTFDGNPLQLSAGIGLVYDYEMPLGALVSYTALESPSIASMQVQVDSARPWLVHPGIPTLSIPINRFMPGSFTNRTRPVVRGVFRPMGRTNAVVVTDGARKGVETDLNILVTSADEARAVVALTDDAATLLLNVPASMDVSFTSRYIAIGDTVSTPVIDKVFEDWMTFSLPFTTVDRPAGGSQSARTWADVLTSYGSWSAVLAHYRSWAEVLAGP